MPTLKSKPSTPKIFPNEIIFLDIESLVHETIGRILVSAIAVAFAAKFIPAIKLEPLAEAVRSEITEFGLTNKLIERVVAAQIPTGSEMRISKAVLLKREN